MKVRGKAGALPLDPTKGREALGTRDFRFGGGLRDWETMTRCEQSVGLPITQPSPKPKVMGVQGPLGSWRGRGAEPSPCLELSFLRCFP